MKITRDVAAVQGAVKRLDRWGTQFRAVRSDFHSAYAEARALMVLACARLDTAGVSASTGLVKTNTGV